MSFDDAISTISHCVSNIGGNTSIIMDDFEGGVYSFKFTILGLTSPTINWDFDSLRPLYTLVSWTEQNLGDL